ncbi:IS3 family transposase [Mycobacterium innocens]|uniref:IS3 family transposase n=1 Tax=Mycobacterium innocens TaxID=2341083 RepID=UPI00142E0FBE|nr:MULTISPECIES: IS3 family transposase [Mycobacterium]
MAATIAWLFAKHKGTWGSPRIVMNLREMGWRVSVNTVAKLMAEQGLVARRRRGTTKPDKSKRKAPDLLGRDFTPPPQPNVAWVGDLTETCIHGAYQASLWTSTMTRRWPGRHCAWRLRCAAGR